MVHKIDAQKIAKSTNNMLMSVIIGIAEDEKPLFFLGHACREDYMLDLEFLDWTIAQDDKTSTELRHAQTTKLIIDSLDIPVHTKYLLIQS